MKTFQQFLLEKYPTYTVSGRELEWPDAKRWRYEILQNPTQKQIYFSEIMPDLKVTVMSNGDWSYKNFHNQNVRGNVSLAKLPKLLATIFSTVERECYTAHNILSRKLSKSGWQVDELNIDPKPTINDAIFVGDFGNISAKGVVQTDRMYVSAKSSSRRWERNYRYDNNLKTILNILADAEEEFLEKLE